MNHFFLVKINKETYIFISLLCNDKTKEKK